MALAGGLKCDSNNVVLHHARVEQNDTEKKLDVLLMPDAECLFDAFFRKAEGGTIVKLIVEDVILAFASKQADGGKLLSAAAQADKADTDAIALNVKYEFVAEPGRRKSRSLEPQPSPRRSALDPFGEKPVHSGQAPGFTQGRPSRTWKRTPDAIDLRQASELRSRFQSSS
jgi:hypothetical protein